MKFRRVSTPLSGEINVPGDKSISHRAVMFGSIAEGDTEITNFLPGADCLSTISCFRKMGIQIDMDKKDTGHVIVHGKGLHGLSAPADILDCGNSGTTTRLILGILAGQDFSCELTGDASIQKRPMKRIMDPLTAMGADIKSKKNNGCAPLVIHGKKLHGIEYRTPVASAQVKSCILLAGLYADGQTTVIEPALSRNHTELMLKNFGAEIVSQGTSVTISPEPRLTGSPIHVPGDISSAACFIAAVSMVPGSHIVLHNVGINPTRDGILRVFQAMGGSVSFENRKSSGGEPTADLVLDYAPLHGTTVGGDIIPTLIDELPLIAVMASVAEGETIIRDAAELRVKESDRIDRMVKGLSAMGVDIVGTDDGMIIQGGRPLHGAVIDPRKDHRAAMAFTVASLAAEGETEIPDADCVKISYPGFYQDLNSLIHEGDR
jgi:3-phosphoshikimate 1-carboxyvinyltransferase